MLRAELVGLNAIVTQLWMVAVVVMLATVHKGNLDIAVEETDGNPHAALLWLKRCDRKVTGMIINASSGRSAMSHQRHHHQRHLQQLRPLLSTVLEMLVGKCVRRMWWFRATEGAITVMALTDSQVTVAGPTGTRATAKVLSNPKLSPLDTNTNIDAFTENTVKIFYLVDTLF